MTGPARQRSLVADLDLIATSPLPQLRDLWQARIGPPLPRIQSADLLRRALAYELQVQAYGGLSAATRRALRAALHVGTGSRRQSTTRLRPGVRLTREWQGELQSVEVLEQGFAWRGTVYRSLSEIARGITGSRWSGPRFFGLVTAKSAGTGSRDG
jgi:hypothetical protein